MLIPQDLLTQTVILLFLAVGFVFVLTVTWRFPKGFFLAVFLLRPLVEIARLLPARPELVQGIINGAGVSIPVLLFVVLLLHGKIWEPENVLPLAFVFAFLFVGLFHEMNMESGEFMFRVLAPLALLIFPQAVIKSEKDLKTFLRIVAFSSVLVLIAVYIDQERTNIHPVFGWVQDRIPLGGGEARNRLAAVFGVPTMTAFWLFQFFAVVYFLFETERAPRRYLWAVLSAGTLVPIYFTFSRAAWLSCVAVIILYNLFVGRWRRTAVWVVSLVMVALVAVPDILFRLQNPGKASFRLQLWAGYFQSLTAGGPKAWLSGLGYANLPEKNPFSGHMISPGATGLVENSFVFLLAGAGLLTLLIFGLMILDLARRARGLTKHARNTFAGDFGAWSLSLLAAWFIMSISADVVSYAIINWYWYAYFGCIYALGKHLTESVKPQGVDRSYFPEASRTFSPSVAE